MVVSTVAGCGDDDAETTPSPRRPRTPAETRAARVAGRDAAGTDSQTKTDTGEAKDTGTDADEPEEAGTDAGADATPDADASADADAGTKPDADARCPDASPGTRTRRRPSTQGTPTICHPGTVGTITKRVPARGDGGGAKVGYSECPEHGDRHRQRRRRQGRSLPPNVKTGFDGRSHRHRPGFRRTISGWIRRFVRRRRTRRCCSSVGTGISPYENAKAHVPVFINGSGACPEERQHGHDRRSREATVTYVDSAGATVAGGKTAPTGSRGSAASTRGPTRRSRSRQASWVYARQRHPHGRAAAHRGLGDDDQPDPEAVAREAARRIRPRALARDGRPVRDERDDPARDGLRGLLFDDGHDAPVVEERSPDGTSQEVATATTSPRWPEARAAPRP